MPDIWNILGNLTGVNQLMALGTGISQLGKGTTTPAATTPATTSSYNDDQNYYLDKLELILKNQTDNTDAEIASILNYAQKMISAGYFDASLPAWEELYMDDYLSKKQQEGLTTLIPGQLYCDTSGTCYDNKGIKMSDSAVQTLFNEASSGTGMTEYQRAQLDLAYQQLAYTKAQANAELGLGYDQLGLERDKWIAGLEANPSDWIERWFAASGLNLSDYLGQGEKGGRMGGGAGGYGTGVAAGYNEQPGSRWDYGQRIGYGKTVTPEDLSQGQGLYTNPVNFGRYNDVLAGGTMDQAKELQASGWIGNINPAIIQAQPEYKELMGAYEDWLNNRVVEYLGRFTGQNGQGYPIASGHPYIENIVKSLDAYRKDAEIQAANAAIEGISTRTQQGLPTITGATENYNLKPGVSMGQPTEYAAPTPYAWATPQIKDIIERPTYTDQMAGPTAYSPYTVPANVGSWVSPEVMAKLGTTTPTQAAYNWTPGTAQLVTPEASWSTTAGPGYTGDWSTGGYQGINQPYTGNLGLTPSQQAIRQVTPTTEPYVGEEYTGPTREELEASAKAAYRNALVAAQTYGEQSPEYLSALQAYNKLSGYYMGENPIAPPWLSKFVSGTATGLPAERLPITTPSGQQWYATPESQRQGLSSYANWAAGTQGAPASMEDIIDQMNIMRSVGIGSKRWTPAYQYA